MTFSPGAIFITNGEDVIFLAKSRQNDVAIRDHKMCFFLLWHIVNLSFFLNAFVRNDPHATSTTGW